MEPWTMKTAGEEWARDRQQQRRERELQMGRIASDEACVGHWPAGHGIQALWSRLWRRRVPQSSYAEPTDMPDTTEPTAAIHGSQHLDAVAAK
ncbi:MAG: hypothetical protein M3R24_38250 [Chloroflexota bacterium]|nr:hypothetical protein [Chloroflexota bacterium]